MSNEVIKDKLENCFGNYLILKLFMEMDQQSILYKQFKGSIGFISALSHTFCNSCNRVRITCDGSIKLCLNYDDELNIKERIRNGMSDEELKNYLYHCIMEKPLCHSLIKAKIYTDHRKMVQIGGEFSEYL